MIKKAEAEAKIESKGGLKLGLPQPEYTYHYEYLETARQLEDVSGKLILNPRNLNANSILEVDYAWITDMKTYRDEIKFWYDYDKRPVSMR